MGVVAPVKPSATMTDFAIEAHETLLTAAPALVATVEIRVSEPSSASPETAEVERERRRMKIPFEEMGSQWLSPFGDRTVLATQTRNS